MSFARPEVFDGFWRWREAFFGLFVAVCGMSWAVTQVGVLAAVGMSISIIGAVIIFAGVQRTRFRTTEQAGAGLVQVADRIVTYYGPRDGGAVAVDALEFVQLDPTQKPAAWVLQEAGGQPLTIPTDAQDAQLLFGVFATLQGIKAENMSAKLRENPGEPVLIWHETQRRVH